jgi:hypothetical protein
MPEASDSDSRLQLLDVYSLRTEGFVTAHVPAELLRGLRVNAPGCIA